MSATRTLSAAAILAALVGLAASLHAYVTPATGVDDTAGPLLAALGHAGMAAIAIGLLVLSGSRGALLALYLLAAIGTCLAGFLLQQPLIVAPAVIALFTLPLGRLIGDTG